MFRKWPKIPRWENETFTITEKIDGTNACIAIVPNDKFNNLILSKGFVPQNILIDCLDIFAHSRTRIITPEDDNYGFAAFVEANREELKQLGIGYHYGEWWGQGINRNYGLKEKRFSLFSQHYTNLPDCCNQVPLLEECDSACLQCTIKDIIDYQKEYGSDCSPGFMNPEGIIIQSNLYLNVRYKYIIDK